MFHYINCILNRYTVPIWVLYYADIANNVMYYDYQIDSFICKTTFYPWESRSTKLH